MIFRGKSTKILPNKKGDFLKQRKHEKAVIKFSQGSVVTRTVFGGLTIYFLIANFLWHTSNTIAKNYENWLTLDSYCG